MKNHKIFSKKTLTLAAMVVALGAAVWLNVKYSTATAGNGVTASGTKYLGEAMYVSNASGKAVATSATTEEDYFASAVSERSKTRKEALETLKETISDVKLGEKEKAAAVSELAKITDNQTAEAAIETLLAAKGFKNAVVVIGKDNVNVIIKSDHEILDSESMQITDAVKSQTDVLNDKIKIVTLK